MPAQVHEDFQALMLRLALALDQIVESSATDHVRHVFFEFGFCISRVIARINELDGMS